MAPLDNPIWFALTSAHAALAVGDGLARRYPTDVEPFAAIVDGSREATRALRDLMPANETVILFSTEPLPPIDGVAADAPFVMQQMIAAAPRLVPVPGAIEVVRLGPDDVPAMLELAALTRPGPFRERTCVLGTYVGIRSGDRLVAMAGERLRLPGFVEVSAVCVHPDHRGKGYAAMLISEVVRGISAHGGVPFLHVVVGNTAIGVYERLGFVTRQTVYATVLHTP